MGGSGQYGQHGDVPFDPAFVIVNGHASLVVSSNGPTKDQGFQTVICGTQNGATKTIRWGELPKREGREHQWIVPLYVHYDPAAIPK
jgi:hypothetical protein